MPIIRPTCRVRLQLRLDEGAEGITPAADPLPMMGVSGSRSGVLGALEKNSLDRQLLGKLKKNLSPPDFAAQSSLLDQERSQLQAAITSGPQAYPGGVDPSKGIADDGTVILEVIPVSAVITKAPSKDANTAQVVFDFRALPIDPRSVRAAFVAITLGTVSSNDYADGMGEREVRGDGSSKALVAHEDGQELRLHSSSRFVGFAATWTVDLDEGGDFVTIDCVDASAVLRSQRLLGKKIDLTKPIDQGVQELVDSYPASIGFRVVLGTPVDKTDPDKVQAPTGALTPADVMPPAQKRRKGKKAATVEKSDKETVWDLINDAVLRLGLIPVVRGLVLYLMEPRVLYADVANSRKLVYGRNLKKLKIARKMEGITTDTIEIRCPDRSIGRVRWARYPVLSGEPTSGILGQEGSPQPVYTRSSKVTPNGTGHEQVRVLTVRGVAELATLEKIAECTWHEISRQEVHGNFATDEIESWESLTEADLLDLEPGEPVQILVEQPSQTNTNLARSSYQELAGMSVAKRQSYLEGWGISRAVAGRLARAQELVSATSAFRAGYTTINWSADSGVSIEGDFYNFIVIREDPESEAVALGKRTTSLGEAFNQ